MEALSMVRPTPPSLKTQPLVLTVGELAVDLCREQGLKHVLDVSLPGTILNSEGIVRPDVRFFQEYVLLIPEGGEDLRDKIALVLGDEKTRWAYFPEEPENIPVVVLGARRMWIDEVARMSDIPDSGPPQVYETGFDKLDDHGWKLTTPAFMPIIGPYGSGKSIFLRQLLVNLWKKNNWKFALTAFEEKVRPRYERDLMRHLIGEPEDRWEDGHIAWAQEEIDKMAVFIRRKRNTLLDVDRLIDRIDYAARVYDIRVVAIDPFNEIDHCFDGRSTSKTDYVGQTIMRFKQLADDHNLLFIVCLHPPKDGVEKRLSKSGMLTLNDGADSANWGNKADFGICMWRNIDGPTLLHLDKVKDHETCGRPILAELFHDAKMNRFKVARLGYDILEDAAMKPK